MSDEKKNKEVLWPASHFIGLIKAIMDREGISCSDLAEKMGRTPANVYQFLSKPGNHNLKTMFEIAWTLGQRIHMSLYPYREDMLPSAAGCLSEIWPGEEEIPEGRGEEFLVTALIGIPRVIGVAKGVGENPGVIVTIDDSEISSGISADIAVFACTAYVSSLMRKNIPVRIIRQIEIDNRTEKGEENE